MRSVIVLCTGNICRSPMAEAVLRAHLEQRVAAPGERDLSSLRVASAGLGALVDHPADAHAVQLMALRGIDIREHRGQAFSGALGLAHDLILTMNVEQRHHVERQWPLLQGRTFTLGHFSDSEIDDPYRRGKAAFERALDDIEEGIAGWLPVLTG